MLNSDPLIHPLKKLNSPNLKINPFTLNGQPHYNHQSNVLFHCMQSSCCEAEDHNQKIECRWQKHTQSKENNLLASDSQTGQKEQ